MNNPILWDFWSRFNQLTMEQIDRISTTAAIVGIVCLAGLLLARHSEKKGQA